MPSLPDWTQTVNSNCQLSRSFSHSQDKYGFYSMSSRPPILQATWGWGQGRWLVANYNRTLLLLLLLFYRESKKSTPVPEEVGSP